MKDKGLIYAGLLIFIAVVTFPFWVNLGKAVAKPDPVLAPEARAAETCVMPADWMKKEHMQLLDKWRDTVVRGEGRMFVNPSGQQFNMSLSNSCLACHGNKTEFCDRCHSFASVDPYCWDCHIDNPKEN